MNQRQLLREALHEQGQSLTHPRQIVFEAMQGKEPVTMAELVKLCLGKADRASVYRTVALFEKIGIIQRLQIGWKYRLELTDRFHKHHHHLTCLRCGRVIPISESKAFHRLLEAMSATENFTMHAHQLEITGLCLKCSKT